MSDLNELMGASSPTASFLQVGAAHEGTILSYEKSQQRDLATGKPKFWEDGNPMIQWVFTIQTEEVDPEIEDDDGRRRIFAKAQMLDAIRKAIRKSGHKGDIVGGTLGVKYTADGEKSRAGYNAPKVYAARFEAPPAGTDYDEYGDGPF